MNFDVINIRSIVMGNTWKSLHDFIRDDPSFTTKRTPNNYKMDMQEASEIKIMDAFQSYMDFIKK